MNVVQLSCLVGMVLLANLAMARMMPCEQFDARLSEGSYSSFVLHGTRQESMQKWYSSIRDAKVILVGELVSFAPRYENPALKAFNEARDEDCRVYPEYWMVRTKKSWKSEAEPLQAAVVYAWFGTSTYVGGDVLLILWDRRDVPFLIGNGRPIRNAVDTLGALDDSVFKEYVFDDDLTISRLLRPASQVAPSKALHPTGQMWAGELGR